MVEDGLLLDEAEPFDELMERTNVAGAAEGA